MLVELGPQTLKTWGVRMPQLAAEVFEDKVPSANDLALRTGPAAPAAAAPAADKEALPARAAPADADDGWRLPAALQSRSASKQWQHPTCVTGTVPELGLSPPWPPAGRRRPPQSNPAQQPLTYLELM